jgi:hypothetical protein
MLKQIAVAYRPSWASFLPHHVAEGPVSVQILPPAPPKPLPPRP